MPLFVLFTAAVGDEFVVVVLLLLGPFLTLFGLGVITLVCPALAAAAAAAAAAATRISYLNDYLIYYWWWMGLMLVRQPRAHLRVSPSPGLHLVP